VRLSARRHPVSVNRSAFSGFRFPAEVITVAVRWYLRYGLSHRDVEELLAERGVQVECPGRSGKDVGKQFGRGHASYLDRGRRSGRRPDDQIGAGHIQPGIKQAGDDADQPRIASRSATTEDQRSRGRGARPPYVVDLPLILAGPRPVAVPWRVDPGDLNPSPDPSPADSGESGTPLSSAMPSEAVVEVKCKVEEGVVFMGVTFRELPVRRSRWRLPQSLDRGLQGSTHCGYFGAIRLVFDLTGQAMIEGVEMIGYTVTQGERINHAAFMDVTNHLAGLPGIVFMAIFFIGASLGIVIAMLAVWRGRAVPGIAAALPVACRRGGCVPRSRCASRIPRTSGGATHPSGSLPIRSRSARSAASRSSFFTRR
jgi:hypothetical protein